LKGSVADALKEAAAAKAKAAAKAEAEKSLRNGVHNANGIVWGPVSEAAEPGTSIVVATTTTTTTAPSPDRGSDLWMKRLAMSLTTALCECDEGILRAGADPDAAWARTMTLPAPWKVTDTQARPIHWSPYDRVGVVNADP
jgi:hypothetical protein